MTRTDLHAFFDLVNLIADDCDGWSEVLSELMLSSDEGIAALADELDALRRTSDFSGYVSAIAARECGFTHRDLLRLLAAGILSEVAEVGDGFRVSFTGLGSLPMALGMVA